MSRTDTHRPMRVQERDRTLRHEFYDDHDHSDGVCDIERRRADPFARWTDTSCHINYCGQRNLCGCRGCSGFWARRRFRRRRRAAVKALCRQLCKDVTLEESVLSQPYVKQAWESFGAPGRTRDQAGSDCPPESPE